VRRAFGHVTKTGDRSSRLIARERRVAALPRDGKNLTENSAAPSTDYTTAANIVPKAKLKLRPTPIEFAVEPKRRPRHDVRATARLPHPLASWRVLLFYATRVGSAPIEFANPASSGAGRAHDTASPWTLGNSTGPGAG
jgi:hypothetical protein